MTQPRDVFLVCKMMHVRDADDKYIYHLYKEGMSRIVKCVGEITADSPCRSLPLLW